jgi:hypothetical protein
MHRQLLRSFTAPCSSPAGSTAAYALDSLKTLCVSWATVILLICLLVCCQCSAFMLVGAKHKVTVGEVESQHKQEVSELIEELAAAGADALGVQLDSGVVERLNAYARSVAHFPTAVKEFEWRNGYFYNLTQQALQQGRPDPCPKHTALLKEVKAI